MDYYTIMDKVRVSLYLNQKQYRTLKSKLALEGKSVSSLIGMWIDKYLNNNIITQQHNNTPEEVKPSQPMPDSIPSIPDKPKKEPKEVLPSKSKLGGTGIFCKNHKSNMKIGDKFTCGCIVG